jgi:hypothetical protein
LDGRTFWHGKKCFFSIETFLWPKIRQDDSKYNRSCTAYAIAKPTIKKKGLYTHIPTPKRPWESISMDYMSGLMSTKKGNDYLFVVVDRFLKMAILTTYKKNITAETFKISSLNGCGSIFGYNIPSPHIRIVSSSTHFGRVFSHCWTPSSLNPLPSMLKSMAKKRLSIR